MSRYLCPYKLSSLVLMALSVTCVLERQCLQITQPQCANFFYGNQHGDTEPSLHSTFPNVRNLQVLQALHEFANFNSLLYMNNYCSYLLHSFLCIHYFPPCHPNDAERPMVVPCRSVCEEAMAECLDRVYVTYNISRPEHLECENFPVVGTEDCEYIVACPAPAIHFDFDLPFGRKYYTVLESDEQVEVCVRLTNTGSHSELSCPVYIDLTPCSDSGTGEDYDWTKNQIVFEMGSVKGDRHCFQITITDDLTSELVERFYVHAHVFTNGSWVESRSGSVSGSGSGSSGTTSGESSLTDELHFGGALNSPVGSVEVLITDNDVCHMPAKHYLRKCSQRTNANGRIFLNNNYTYAARIELLGVKNYSMCTAIEARIVECWEIRKNACPPANTLHVIPTCPACPTLQLVKGNHYLIAGVRAKIKGLKRLILPCKRSTGLFGSWNDNDYANIDAWVKLARSG